MTRTDVEYGELINKALRKNFRTEDQGDAQGNPTIGLSDEWKEDSNVAMHEERGPRRVTEEYRREEDYTDEDDETKKALSSIVRTTAMKYFGGGRNTPAVDGMLKEFDDIMSQVFQPHGGVDNAVNLRTPGQPPGKIPAQPGNSGRNRTGSYRTEDQPENPNPTELGSGFVHGNAREDYGSIPLGTGPRSKPRGDYSIPTGSFPSGSGVPPSHPRTAQSEPIGTYQTGTRLESVRIPSDLPPEVHKRLETAAMIKSLASALFKKTDEELRRFDEEEANALESYGYGQRQPTRNEEEMRRKVEEDEMKERNIRNEEARAYESMARREEELASTPAMNEYDKESHKNLAMAYHERASKALSGGTSEFSPVTYRKMPAVGGGVSIQPVSGIGRKNVRVAGSRGSPLKA